MRNAENNEIDLLLRSLAQRESSGPANASNGRLEERDGPGEHLDTDELSSFAEDVLPAATRSRYIAHVADCSRCRRIVAQLALASGAGVNSVSTEASKSKLWNYIASFLTPAVMRYGVPAMSLIILAAIGLVWFQQTRQPDSVVQLSRPVEQAPAQVGDQQNNLSEQQEREVSVARMSGSKTTAPAGQETGRDEEKAKSKSEVSGISTIERELQPAEKKTDVKDVAAAPAAAPAQDANSAFSPRPAKEGEESKREELAKQRQAPAVPNAAIQSEDERRNRQDKDDVAVNKKAEARRTSEVGVAGGRPMATGATAATRTVGGRHFRRVNNSWIDTAYDSGSQTITVSRGSEQYRALIGDEPSLRAIVEQLDGEVIVVWKGRAYRIR